MVGICFGHQLLAQALGGQLVKSEKGSGLGLHSFRISRRKLWMIKQPKQYALYFFHQDQVTRLPPRADLLGGNAFCPNAFFSVGDRVLGIQ
jgi:GMP synthase-like glutamine amidotransferase